MGQDNIAKYRYYMATAYICMFLGLFTIIFVLIAYMPARAVATSDNVEVWMQAQAFWIVRSIIIFILLALFSALWFIPLLFVAWNSALWATACTIIGVIFAVIAWLYLLDAWIKGVLKYVKKKAVF